MAPSEPKKSPILRLPELVMDLVFKDVIQVKINPSYTSNMMLVESNYEKVLTKTRIQEIGKLRLVCKQWAQWFYHRCLYDNLTIGCTAITPAYYRATTLIGDLKCRCETGSTPRCRFLKIDSLWTWGLLNRYDVATKTEFDHLNALLDIFSQTLIALDIQAVNFFTLPNQTIERIGRLPNLKTLRLRIKFTKGSSFRGVPKEPSAIPYRLPTDSECLTSLLKAARGVTSLDLTDFRPVCSPETLCAHLGDIQFDAIRTLKIDVKVQANLTNAGLVSLSTRLPSLTTLQVGGLGYDGSALVPVFQNVSRQLEEIVLNDARVWRHLRGIHYPQLRVVKTHHGLILDSISDLAGQLRI